jgi:hypothetical protein
MRPRKTGASKTTHNPEKVAYSGTRLVSHGRRRRGAASGPVPDVFRNGQAAFEPAGRGTIICCGSYKVTTRLGILRPNLRQPFHGLQGKLRAMSHDSDWPSPHGQPTILGCHSVARDTISSHHRLQSVEDNCGKRYQRVVEAQLSALAMQPFMCRPNRPAEAWQRHEELSILSITHRMRSDSFANIDEFAKLTNHIRG